MNLPHITGMGQDWRLAWTHATHFPALPSCPFGPDRPGLAAWAADVPAAPPAAEARSGSPLRRRATLRTDDIYWQGIKAPISREPSPAPRDGPGSGRAPGSFPARRFS